MKQYIVLVSMIVLGVVLVNLIIGPDGVGTKAKSVLSQGYELRTECFE